MTETETVRLDLTPEAYETIARASSGDTGTWGIWFHAVVDGRMRLATTPPPRMWTKRELDEDITRLFTIRPVGVLFGPFTYAYVTAREIALHLASQEDRPVTNALVKPSIRLWNHHFHALASGEPAEPTERVATPEKVERMAERIEHAIRSDAVGGTYVGKLDADGDVYVDGYLNMRKIAAHLLTHPEDDR